jgi:hypothetical protein
MAFDTLLVNTAVRVTKDNIKFNESINKLKIKLLDSGKNFLSEAGINKIPNLDKIINGINFDNPSSIPQVNINNLIDPTTLSQIGEIPNSEEILNNLNKFESTLNNLISTKNRLTNVLTKTQASLEVTRKTADTLNKILTGVDTSVKLLKTLPIPTAYPPGIGIPLGIINTFSDILDKLSDYIKKGKGPLSQIPKVLKIINDSINDVLSKLNSLDKLILSLLQIIVILKTLLKYGPNASQEEIDEIVRETSNNLNFTSTGNNSSLIVDSLNENALLKCLSSNSNDPCVYKGFLLNVEYNPNNKFSFPSRRIKGYNKEIDRLVYNNSIYESDNPEGYSFSSSLETLLEEIKYVIDTYLSESNIEIP